VLVLCYFNPRDRAAFVGGLKKMKKIQRGDLVNLMRKMPLCHASEGKAVPVNGGNHER
jgi:hypothetical protein